jgi:transcription initiation factor TFIID subunit TAF12
MKLMKSNTAKQQQQQQQQQQSQQPQQQTPSSGAGTIDAAGTAGESPLAVPSPDFAAVSPGPNIEAIDAMTP